LFYKRDKYYLLLAIEYLKKLGVIEATLQLF